MAIYDKQMTFEDISPEYSAFVEKFKPKKTTDDCHTPDSIYEAVLEWTCRKYGIERETVVRPFWPGGDFERFDYPDGCFVLDNPPFSILSRIVRFYMRHKIRFLLFAPSLSLFVAPESGARYLVAHVTITYANGAGVNTSFVTSEGEWRIEVCPDLHRILDEVNEGNRKEKTKKTRKYVMPDCVATSARLGWLAVHNTPFHVSDRDALYLHDLDCGCNLFGGGFLLSERAAAERAAAERAAAERAAAERVLLSERELEIIKRLG
ncbi:MAG: hypothetical protein IJJ33_11405 [Victivallales bacterium]|nr:hypothetical protein [Victivallales bacterium]